MLPLVEEFFEKAKAVASPELLHGAKDQELALLQSEAGNPLPQIWADLVSSCLGTNSSFFSHVLHGPQLVEPFSYESSAGAEIDLVDDLITGQRHLEALDLRPQFGAQPLFFGGEVTGDGSWVLFVGSDDPVVLLLSGTAYRSDRTVVLLDGKGGAQSWGLVCLRMSSWLKGLLPVDGVGDWIERHLEPRPTLFGSSGTIPPPAEIVEVVDQLLDSMMTTPLDGRDAPAGEIGREWIVGTDHSWISPRPNRFRYLEIDSGSLRSRYRALINAIVGTAIISLSGGHVDDHIGAFGQGLAARLTPVEAQKALTGMKVNGDFDDLCLHYRYTVAKPSYQQRSAGG